jgi:hypothetical protein
LPSARATRPPANAITTTSITSGDLAYTWLKNVMVKLDTADVPDVGRWAVVPPWFHGLLLDNNKFVANPATADKAIRSGLIGQVLGMDVYKSNSNPNITGDDWLVWAGVKAALSLVVQINSVEPYRPENAFSDAVKGLTIFGAKLVRPDHIATLTASIT